MLVHFLDSCLLLRVGAWQWLLLIGSCDIVMLLGSIVQAIRSAFNLLLCWIILIVTLLIAISSINALVAVLLNDLVVVAISSSIAIFDDGRLMLFLLLLLG